jgi:hypothetical protein
VQGSTKNVVLACEVCEERMVLGGPLSVWRSESTTFACECGEQLTLADRLDSGESNKMATIAAAKVPTSLLYP